MQTLPPWILIMLSLALLAGAGLLLWRRQIKSGKEPLPADWALAPRPAFNPEERRFYRQLREALPSHVLLSKLPLVRFCQPTDPQAVHYWYELLGSIDVTFAVCSAHGRVLAAIDLEHDRGSSRRAMQIKQSVLAACEIRYLRCPSSPPPSILELQRLVPQTEAEFRSPQPAAIVVSQPHGPQFGTPASNWRERPTLRPDPAPAHDPLPHVQGHFEIDDSGACGPLPRARSGAG
jgi:hypothetical protein